MYTYTGRYTYTYRYVYMYLHIDRAIYIKIQTHTQMQIHKQIQIQRTTQIQIHIHIHIHILAGPLMPGFCLYLQANSSQINSTHKPYKWVITPVAESATGAKDLEVHIQEDINK